MVSLTTHGYCKVVFASKVNRDPDFADIVRIYNRPRPSIDGSIPNRPGNLVAIVLISHQSFTKSAGQVGQTSVRAKKFSFRGHTCDLLHNNKCGLFVHPAPIFLQSMLSSQSWEVGGVCHLTAQRSFLRLVSLFVQDG